MKCSDLQIGDWVKIDYNNQKVKVTAVYNNWIDTSSISPLMSKVSPIPLTKEILEKNGFTHCLTAPCGYYHTPVYEMFDILFHISEDTYEDTWHTEVFTDHNDNNFVLYNLCFVHELQHALRLCGLNELADNLKLEEVK